MADIPHKFVRGRIKNAMQRERQLHNAEIRTQMPAIFRENRDQFVTNFLTQLAQLLKRQFFDVLGFIHHFQESAHIILLITPAAQVSILVRPRYFFPTAEFSLPLRPASSGKSAPASSLLRTSPAGSPKASPRTPLPQQ